MSSKNKGAGGRNRRKRARRNDVDLIHGKECEKTDGQEYAKVAAVLGSGRFKVLFLDGKQRICKVRGKMQRKEYVRRDDLVLVELREYQNEKADIVHKFRPDEVKNLIKSKQVPASFIAGSGDAEEIEFAFVEPAPEVSQFNYASEESSSEENSWEGAANLQQPNRNLDRLPTYESDSENEPVTTVIDLEKL